ncbi:hypothetical protein [Ekhidna sp.]|uniref:hypothetical protein n=1 Tax=Ekhidna sp. TaxID=2608089 RepID=UPI003B507C1A
MRFTFIIIVFVIGCKASSPANNFPEIENQSLFIEDRRESANNEISITFKNVSENDVLVVRPLEPMIERWTGENWERVSVLYCDCESPCPAPPQERSIGKGGYFVFSWNGIEEECVQGDQGRITNRSKASPGHYRVIYSIGSESTSSTKLESRFTISE